MTPPDTDPSVILAGIREHNERVIALCEMAPAVVKQLAEHDVPAAVAAVEAVLALHHRRDKPVKTHSLCRDHSALAHHSGRMPVEVIAICPECTVTEKYVCDHCRHECPDDDAWPCPTSRAITAALTETREAAP